MEENSGIRLKWERIYKEICKEYVDGSELDDDNEDDYLTKMGIDKRDYLQELNNLDSYGVNV